MPTSIASAKAAATSAATTRRKGNTIRAVTRAQAPTTRVPARTAKAPVLIIRARVTKVPRKTVVAGKIVMFFAESRAIKT